MFDVLEFNIFQGVKRSDVDDLNNKFCSYLPRRISIIIYTVKNYIHFVEILRRILQLEAGMY